jgi:colicin import membrane protein
MAVATETHWLKAHWPYLFGAVLLHVLIAGVFGLTMLQMQRDVPPPTLAIQATVVDLTQVPKPSRQAQLERERQQREAEEKAAAERRREEEEATKRQQEQEQQAEQQKREQERVREEQVTREREAQEAQEKIAKEKVAAEQRAVERKQQEEAERQKKVAAERQAKADAERKRVAEIERKQREREEAERKRAAAEADAREKQLRDQLAEEEGLMQARSSPAMSQYAAQIQQAVERQWNRPPSARSGLECVVAVSQSPNGTVLRVQVEQCNGDAAVKQSIENAVQRASPLPLPSDMRLFERNLRFIFKPAD